MQWVSLGFALAGVGAAIAIPLWVEYQRRPRLRIERGEDANQWFRGMQGWRIVHVQIFNEPITGRGARWLLRNTASGCHVKIRFRNRSDGKTMEWRGKWSARPEPIQALPITLSDGTQTIEQFWDPQKEPAMFSYDLPAGEDGEPVAVAIKHDDDPEAYVYAAPIYYDLPGPLKHPALVLPDTKYDITVRATAGEIVTEERFVLRNDGPRHTGLALE